MQAELERAAKARELAEWFRITAGDDAEFGALMACAADILDNVADDETQDAVPEVAPVEVIVRLHAVPMAINDNAPASLRRTRH